MGRENMQAGFMLVKQIISHHFCIVSCSLVWGLHENPTTSFIYFSFNINIYHLVNLLNLQLKHINRLIGIFWKLKEILFEMMVLLLQQQCWLVTIFMLPMLGIRGL